MAEKCEEKAHEWCLCMILRLHVKRSLFSNFKFESKMRPSQVPTTCRATITMTIEMIEMAYLTEQQQPMCIISTFLIYIAHGPNP